MDLNSELEKAVCNDNLEKVTAVLFAGANVHVWVDGQTLLHLARSVGVLKELFKHGANVHIQNRYGDTALHNAITGRKGCEFVRELLKHGSHVDAMDRKGNTPLNIAMKQTSPDLKEIEELLKYGANLNNRNPDDLFFYNLASPLNHGIGPVVFKLYIKFTMLRNCSKDCKNFIIFNSCNIAMVSYRDDCICELTRMETDKLNDTFSLFEFVTTKNTNIEARYVENIPEQVSEIVTANYPIYHDIILAKIKSGFERAGLLKKVKETRIYTDASIHDGERKRIILNFDCTSVLAKYLSNDDLTNLIIAFSDFDQHSQPSKAIGSETELNKQSNKRPCEDSTSICSKHERLN